MSVTDWNWREPVELQDVPWDCAAASTAWCLQAAGLPWTEAEVVNALYPTYISPTYGLLDASGAGLVQWLASIGVSADNNPNATYQQILDAAGSQPMLMGGRYWCHWTGVRISTNYLAAAPYQLVALANPAPNYMGVGQVIDESHFDELGPFSAVWFTSW